LFYETYTNQKELVNKMHELKEDLQCIVSNFEIEGLKTISFGKTQEPTVFDFADDVNTLSFLNKI